MKLSKCFKFTGEERFFQGHFPEAPILPGVVQLEFTHRLAEEALGQALTLKAVKKMKFIDIIAPGDEIAIEVETDKLELPTEVKYVILKGEKLCSSGVLSY